MAGQLIVGLDVSSRARAEEIVALLDGQVDFFKKVFFDLKLLDIDNTVEKGVAAIAETGATMLTVHAYPQCMRAAVRGARGSDLCVLGVSVLTSMDDADVAEAGYARDAAGLSQAALAERAGSQHLARQHLRANGRCTSSEAERDRSTCTCARTCRPASRSPARR